MGLCLVVALSACKVKKVEEQSILNTTSSTIENMKKVVCAAEGSEINWSEYTSDIEFTSDNVPTNYKAFTADPTIIKEHFISREDDGTNFTLALPIYMDNNVTCTVYNIAMSSTMSPELQKKYGGVKTFKGQGTEYADQSIRVEYSEGVGMRAYLNINDKVILFMPYQIGSEIIYICFDKTESGGIKFPFEK